MIVSRTAPVAAAAYSIVVCISLLDTTELEIVSDTDSCNDTVVDTTVAKSDTCHEVSNRV